MKKSYVFKVKNVNSKFTFIALAIEETQAEAENTIRDTFGDEKNPLVITLTKESFCIPTSGCGTYIGMVEKFTK